MKQRLPIVPLLMGLLLAVAGGGRARAQQDPLYSQYMFNTLAFNPAYAGTAGVLTAMALSRHQWVGFEGAPNTQTLAMHSPLPLKGLSAGATFLNDRLGPSRQTSMLVDVAYRIRTGEASQLSFGLKGGVNFLRVDLTGLGTVVADDPTAVGLSSKALPNFGFGLFWHSDRHYVGLSSPKLLQNRMLEAQGVLVTNAREERHYFLQAGTVLDLGRYMKLRPSVMVRAVGGAPLSVDLNLNVLLNERIWLGGMYRVGNAFGVMAQYRFNEQLRAGYAFDLTTTRMLAYNAGTHEIMVGYDLRFTKGRTISPRYF